MPKNNIVLSLVNILILCAVILFVSAYFIYQAKYFGYTLIALGFLCLLSLKLFGIKIRSVNPDIVFGIIDNGILAAMAVFGAEIAGIAGAIIGGVVGNAVTDGIAGIFEGYWAEILAGEKRTILGTAVGKMSGCLFGAGFVLVVAELLDVTLLFA